MLVWMEFGGSTRCAICPCSACILASLVICKILTASQVTEHVHAPGFGTQAKDFMRLAKCLVSIFHPESQPLGVPTSWCNTLQSIASAPVNGWCGVSVYVRLAAISFDSHGAKHPSLGVSAAMVSGSELHRMWPSYPNPCNARSCVPFQAELRICALQHL
jgi:hypothetical protein